MSIIMNQHLDFIIERKLKFSVGGKITEGKIRIGGIKKFGKAYGCYCFLSHITRTGKYSYGEDPLQALMLGLKHLQELLDSAVRQDIEFWCDERGDNGGF